MPKVKETLRSLRDKIQKFRQARYDQKMISAAQSKAQQLGFDHLSLLGKGKDSISFQGTKQNQKFVVKVLSDYARTFLPVTKDLLKKCPVAEMMDVQFVDDQILYYPYLELKSPNANPKSLLTNFSLICDFQQKLIERGFVMWDFGVTGTNYMLFNQGLKIIDYGGNAFLYLNKSAAPISKPRTNLVVARNEFIQQAVLIHFIVLGIGQTTASKWGSYIQDHEDLTESKEAILQYVRGTMYQKLAEIVFALDLTTAKGWESLKKQIETYFNESSLTTLDLADIDQISFQPQAVTVTGYQNYIVKQDNLESLDRGHEWANTKIKWNIVTSQMKKLNFQTYLDIGSNLGLYVFTANVLCGARATGVDYNQDYIAACKKIANHLNLNCDFITKEFGKIETQYDCVSMLGVIHHIYNRTESFGNLKDVIKKLSDITGKYAIVEFPTENDLKAAKWIHVPSREANNDYSLKNFLRLSQEHFKSVKLLDSTTPQRPIYILEK